MLLLTARNHLTDGEVFHSFFLYALNLTVFVFWKETDWPWPPENALHIQSERYEYKSV
jgi:hypothetical protein